MKKILLLLVALFAVGGVNVWAGDKVYATYGTPADQGTWNSETGVYSWTQSYSNLMTIFTFTGGALEKYASLHLTTADYTDSYRVCFMNGSTPVATIAFYSDGQKDLVFAERSETKDVDLSQITHISFGGNSGSGSVTLSNVYLEEPDINYIEATKVYEAPDGTTDLAYLTGTETNWENTVIYPKELAVQGASFGNGDGSSESTHVTIDGYDYLAFHITQATSNSASLRVWLWDDVNNQVVTLYPYPIADYATANWTTSYKIKATGTYVVKVSGYKYLKGVKAGNDWGSDAVTVSMAYASKGDAPVDYVPTNRYTLVGEVTGSASLSRALADENATLIDARGVTGTDLTFETANPNCIIAAAPGVFSSTMKNVLVPTSETTATIANLSLTDGYPVATAALASASSMTLTAAQASYTRTMSTQFGTIYLPYEVESDETVKYYTIDRLEGGVLYLEAVETLEAATPAIVEKVGEGTGITAAAENVTLYTEGNDPEGDLQLIGSFQEQTILASNYVGQNIYAISNDKFVQATESITLKPFRAFFLHTPSTTGAAPARLSLGFATDSEEATAIQRLTGQSATVVGIYSTGGARQASLQKGINIVRLADGTTQKVMVK